jgi:hypothetical protein
MTILRKYWLGLIALGIIMLIVVAILKTDYVTVNGTIIEKSTTSDRDGYNIRHYVVIKSDDGFLEQKQGLYFCQYKVGDRIRYKTTRTKDLFKK